MKIITNDAIYVQKRNIKWLFCNRIHMSDSIYKKLMWCEGQVMQQNNESEFIKFDDVELISFFKDLIWIADYEKIKLLSAEEFARIRNELYNQIKIFGKKVDAVYHKGNSVPDSLLKKHDILVFCYLEYGICSELKERYTNVKLPLYDEYKLSSENLVDPNTIPTNSSVNDSMALKRSFNVLGKLKANLKFGKK